MAPHSPESGTMILPVVCWAALALAVLPWVIVLGRRWGAVAAITALTLVGLLGLLVVMIVSAAVGAPLVVVVVVATGLCALAGVGWLLRTRCLAPSGQRGAPRSHRGVVTWLPVLTGSAAWLIVMVVAQVLPGSAPLSWAMQGDSANNVLFGREVIAQHGIEIGPGENPVPLPAGLLGLTMEFGRAGIRSADLLRHDVTAFAAVWMLLIALCGVMCGLAAGAVARATGAGRGAVALAAGVGSMLTFSWFVTGYAAEFGFFNTHLAVLLLAASVIVALEGDRRPAVALGLLCAAGTLTLAVWSPLVVVPGLLGVLVVLRSFRVLLASRGRALWVLILGVGQIVVYGLVAVLPGLVANGEALGAAGGVIGFPVFMLPTAGAVVVVLAAVAVRSWRSLLFQITGTTVVAGGLGLGLLLLAAGGHWTYYPHKYAWTAAILFGVLGTGLVVCVIARLPWPTPVRLGSLVLVVAAVIGFAFVGPRLETGERRQQPFPWILRGMVMGQGDRVADRIFALADREHPRLLWRTQDPFEATINFWLLQMQVDSIADQFDLRLAAYNIRFQTQTTELCADIELIDGPVEVLTGDPALKDELNQTCPENVVAVRTVG